MLVAASGDERNFLPYHHRMPLPTDMTVPVAAAALGCSAPTVRKLVRDGRIPATATRRGQRTFLALHGPDVEAFIETHGTFATGTSTRRASRSATASATDVAALREEVAALRLAIEHTGTPGTPGREPDPRTELVSLRETVQLQRAAITSLTEADAAKSAGTRLMLEAMQAFETADSKRRQATTLLDQVVGSLTLPGNVADLTRPQP